MMELKITLWAEPAPPSDISLRKILTDEGLDFYAWSNEPYDIYPEHTHSYNKVIYVVQGSITFGLPQLARKITLKAGDRLDLPSGTAHDAHIGAEGVVCLEAHAHD